MSSLIRAAPGSGAKNAGHRAAMVAALPCLVGKRERTAKAISRALATTALDRIPADEREWGVRIEAWRRELARSADSRSAEDLGLVDLAAAVEWMSVPPILGRLLMRLVRELKPRSCLELGTGFGFSGAYQAAALELNGGGRLVTVDVQDAWAGLAREGFSKLRLDRAEVRAGEPDETLAGALASAAPVDYAFVDADHQEAPTVEAFESLLPRLSAGSVVVFDDIRYTAEMKRAWRSIGRHPQVAQAVRVGRLGIATTA
jgi:predicted O-methyltransferase YrrM